MFKQTGKHYDPIMLKSIHSEASYKILILYNFFFAATVKKLWYEWIQFISLWNKNKYGKMTQGQNQLIE